MPGIITKDTQWHKHYARLKNNKYTRQKQEITSTRFYNAHIVNYYYTQPETPKKHLTVSGCESMFVSAYNRALKEIADNS